MQNAYLHMVSFGEDLGQVFYLRDQKEKCKRHVEQEGYAVRDEGVSSLFRAETGGTTNSHHRFRHNGSCIFDLFGHMSDAVLAKHHEHT